MKKVELSKFFLFHLTHSGRMAAFICTFISYLLLSNNALAQSDTIYAYDGTIESIRTFSDGKRVGIWHTYYSSGAKNQETTYSTNSKHGKVVEYWPNGGIRYLYYVELVDLTGEYQKLRKLKLFYPNQRIYFECIYHNGIKNGKARSYFENGQVSEVGKMKNDQKIGVWRYYDEKGERIPPPRNEGSDGFSE